MVDEREKTEKLVAQVLEGRQDTTKYPYPLDSVERLAHSLMIESETPTTPSTIWKGDAEYTPRSMPSVIKIYRYWGETLVRLNKFDSIYELVEGNLGVCWGCGMYNNGYSLERAHILPRSFGGTDDVSNLHMLCSKCHSITETVYGSIYWDWFMKNNFMQVHPIEIQWIASKDQNLLFDFVREFGEPKTELIKKVISKKINLWGDFYAQLKETS